ncbi:hypothetical protein DY000_02006819 [Brassica cretica]|uniref:Uncharacterized protein n=1 Tax=Brassica cretica TaxID=69181 RepID=A0ABQ7CKH0_BRACR|nr:hypothetical protein DY000_02006819 [Brassica cretica]
MVDLSICCSEHDVSRCFSEHVGTLLMSWRSWPEPGFIGYKPVDEDGLLGAKPCLGGCRIGELWLWTSFPSSLGRSYVLEYFLFLSDLGRFLPVQAGYLIKGRFSFILKQDKSLGLEAGGWRQGLRPGGRNPEPRDRNPESGGRNPEPGVISSWNIFPQQTSARSPSHPTFLSIVLGCTCARSKRIHSLIGDVWPGEWAIILDSLQTRGLDQDLVNALRTDIAVAQDQVESDFSFHFLRFSGSMNLVEECMGQDPGILRGRILARLRIRGMRRFNTTQRPKLRILMLDPVGLSSAS